MTPWYHPTQCPARDGLYLRDYTNTDIGGWHFDYWISDKIVGFWYVNEPRGEWNDAWYPCLPWRGLTRSEYLEGTI